MDTLTINDPRIDSEIQSKVENEYLRRYFVSQHDVEQEIAANLGFVSAQPPSVPRSATIDAYAARKDDIRSQGEEDDEEDELDEYRSW